MLAARCQRPSAGMKYSPTPLFHSIHGSRDARGPGWPQNPGWESEATRMTLAARGCGTMAHRPAGMGCRDQHWDGERGRGSAGGPRHHPNPSPQPHILTSESWSTPNAQIQTPSRLAPTKSFASTSNSLARKGLGRAFGAFWGLRKCCLCACPAAPWPNRQGKSITAWLLLPSPVPPQLRQVPEGNNLETWEKGAQSPGLSCGGTPPQFSPPAPGLAKASPPHPPPSPSAHPSVRDRGHPGRASHEGLGWRLGAAAMSPDTGDTV